MEVTNDAAAAVPPITIIPPSAVPPHIALREDIYKVHHAARRLTHMLDGWLKSFTGHECPAFDLDDHMLAVLALDGIGPLVMELEAAVGGYKNAVEAAERSADAPVTPNPDSEPE